jgi:cytochrome b subunit of formate dehydrogenase
MSHLLSRLSRSVLLVLFVLLFVSPGPALAADSDNCLMCHRYRGLARVEKDGNYRLFFVDEQLFNRGPHARVSCKGCHADIEKIPHDDAQKVDCLRSCHIEEPNREILFSHEGVREDLDQSAHSPYEASGKLREHSEDFPECKDCHDAPLFRPVSILKTIRAGVSERAISRCTVCHENENFVRYFYSHVTTRLHKARDPREVVEMCSQCHSDPEFIRRHGIPNVVASYTDTFHGKAVLFGSQTTPDCLDCHVTQGNVHQMHTKDDIRSSVNPETRPQTCSMEDCHPDAEPRLATYNPHVTHDPSRDPLEFSVTLVFVLLTLGVLLPMLTLRVFAHLRELFPSRQAEEEVERLTRIAEQEAERTNGIVRFTVSHRTLHVLLVSSFVTLALTGMPLKFPEASWAPFVYGLFGGIDVAPIVHRVAGMVMILGFVVHLVTVARGMLRSVRESRKKRLRAWTETVLALPMFPQISDLKDFVAYVKYTLFISPKKPSYGRFSWKEKFDYLAIFWGLPLLAVTGFMLWGEELFSVIVPGWTLNFAYIAHTDEALLAVVYIVLVHVLSILKPGDTPLRAMVFSGKIDPRVLAEDHGEQVKDFENHREGKS